MDCTPATLVQNARCLCIPSGQRWGVIAYLMCQWAQQEAPVGCGTPSDFIIITGAGTAAANQQYNFINLIIGYQGLTDPDYTIKQDLFGDWWIYHSMVNQYKSTAADFPCVWALDGGAGTGPAPTGVWGVAGPCGKPTNIISITGAGQASANQTYTWDGINYVGDVNPLVLIVIIGPGIWQINANLGTDIWYNSTLSDPFPCNWTLGPDGILPNPTGQYV